MFKIRNLLFLLILFTFSCKDNLHTVVKGKVFLRADGSMMDSIVVGVYRTTGGQWSSAAPSSTLVKEVVTDSDGSYSISFDAEKFTNSGGGKYILFPSKDDTAKNEYYRYEEFGISFYSLTVEPGKTQTIDLPMIKY